MNLVVLPFQFPPTRGGIATWLYSICNNLNDDEIVVFVEKVTNSAEFDVKQHFSVRRWSPIREETFTSFVSFLKAFRTFSKQRNRIHSRLAAPIIRSIKSMNFHQLDYVKRLLDTWLKEEQFHNPDAILCGYALPAGIIAFLLKYAAGIPYIVFVHGMEIFSCQRTKNQKQLMREVLSNANKVITNSRYTRDLVTTTFDIQRHSIEVIHPGVDWKRFSNEPDLSRFRRNLRLGNRKVILTVANLVERKGQDMVIQALPTVVKEYSDLKYIIVGEGEDRPKLEQSIKELQLEKNVCLTGAVPDEDLPAYYYLADIFVMPGRQAGVHVEGFGIAYAEASACAKPVIGGKTGGVVEAVVHGETGILVNPENPNEIGAAILKLLRNPELAGWLGEKGRQRVRKELTWEVGAQKVLQVIQELVHDKTA